MLHIDPWPSHQLEILCTSHTCENKWKQSSGWTEICGCYEMIYADAHMRYMESVLSQCQLAARRDSVSHGSASEWLGTPLGQQPTPVLWLNTLWLRSRRNAKWGLGDNAAWYGQEKKLWVNVAVSICLPLSICLSHTYRDLIPFENKVWELYFYNQVLWGVSSWCKG